MLYRGCHSKIAGKNDAPFRVIATDAGFDAADKMPAGLRHILFENHGSEIHEAMLVKLPQSMTVAEYVSAVRSGSLFPAGALDYSGAGLMSPGESVEVWVKLDPGQCILICWNNGHARSTPPRPVTVEYRISEDVPPKEDVTVKLIDFLSFWVAYAKGRRSFGLKMSGQRCMKWTFFDCTRARRWKTCGVGGNTTQAVLHLPMQWAAYSIATI